MRVAFTGKGGSGKTTISSLFVLLSASDGYRVLALKSRGVALAGAHFLQCLAKTVSHFDVNSKLMYNKR